MPKKNIKRNTEKIDCMQNQLKYFYLCLICFFVHSCNGHTNIDNKISLYFDRSESTIIDERFNLDSIGFQYSKDSIILYIRQLELPFFKKHGNIYELREAYRDMIDYERTDSILTFSTKDTTFTYGSVIDGDFIPNAFDYSLADCKYEIKKIGNNSYVTTKQSLVDTTFKEIYYYDKEYQITKFVNTYKGNICIYTPKK